MVDFVDIHTHNPSGKCIEIVNCRLGVDAIPSSGMYSAGIPPWDAASNSATIDDVLYVLEDPNCVACGEIGLDKRCKVDWKTQFDTFNIGLLTARHPTIIHCVRAQQDVMPMLRDLADSELPVIFHGYIGSTEQAEQIWKAGYYTSFGIGALRSPKTLLTIKACPTDRLFLETDDSKISITALYKEVAHIRNVSIESLKNDIYNNYKRVFNK